MGINSYAQNFEDVMLWRALSHVESGFYIDVGAQDPIVDSVSLAFHERGWRGIHVEPIPCYANSLRERRPGDLVLQAAVGLGPPLLAFYEIAGTGLSTAKSNIVRRHESEGFRAEETLVPCVPLSAIFKYAGTQEIHWLKIDVEGYEREVIASWAPSEARPWIVVIESTLPLTQVESHQEWEPAMLQLGYSTAYFDGLNRFYVSDAHKELLTSFLTPPNVFDRFTVNGSASAVMHQKIKADEVRSEKRIQELEDARAQNAARVEVLENEQQHARRWAEQETRHAAALDAANQELRALGSQIVRSANEAISREQQLSDALKQAERVHVESLSTAHAAHLRQFHELQDSVRMDQQELTLQHEEFAQQLLESLRIVRSDLDTLKKPWFARRFAGDSGQGKSPPAALRRPSNNARRIQFNPQQLLQMQDEELEPARSVEELLELNDHDFVHCAYLSVLRRPADAEGLANYVSHIRAGADRLELIRALATSAEGSLIDPANLAGLKDVIQQVERPRPSVIERIIAGAVTRLLRPFFARMDVVEYRIGKLELLLSGTAGPNPPLKPNGSTEVALNSQLDALDHMTPRARSVYRELKRESNEQADRPV